MKLIIIVLCNIMEIYMRKFVLGLAIVLAACNITSAKEYITLESPAGNTIVDEKGAWILGPYDNLHVDYMKGSNTFVYGSFYENGQKRYVNLSNIAYLPVGYEFEFDYFDKKRGINLWKSDELDMSAYLYYEPGQRKEGFLTVMLLLEDKGVYHANIRFAKGPKGERTLVIGTIQGYKDGLERAKKITKKMYGYRPKNFITFLIREIGRAVQVESILAVSDEGFYANSHMVRGHKSKVAVLDTLWEDIGGSVLESDPNYYVIPLKEERKPIEEIKSQKRSQYRNRYALLDEYESMIQENIKPCLKV